MAITHTGFNQTCSLVLGQSVDLSNLKVMLLNASASFDATDTTIDDVAGAAGPHRANEVYGNGWTEGGELLASVAVSIANTDEAVLTADDINKIASGGDIGPTPYAVVYDATSDAVLGWIDWDGARTAESGTNLLIPFASGVVWNMAPT